MSGLVHKATSALVTLVDLDQTMSSSLSLFFLPPRLPVGPAPKVSSAMLPRPKDLGESGNGGRPTFRYLRIWPVGRMT